MLFHGLAAYQGGNKTFNIINKTKNLINNEVCVSEKPIGPIGVALSGHVTALYDRDVWSYVDYTGQRVTDYQSIDGGEINLDYYKQDYIKAIQDCYPTKKGRYFEGFMLPDSIDCIWIKSDAKPKFKKLARILARQCNIITIVVSNDTNAINWR